MSKNTIVEAHKVLGENLGVTKLEARVLLPIFTGGNMTAGSIGLVVGEKTNRVNRTLTRLMKKGLVIEVEGVVPIYRAVPPGLALTEPLSDMIKEVRKLKKSSNKTLKSHEKNTEVAVSKLLESQNEKVEDTRTLCEDYEKQMLESVHNHIELVSEIAENVLSGIAEGVEQVLTEFDIGLDDNLGEKLAELQTELDRSQRKLRKDVKVINREFNKWLKEERSTSKQAITQFEEKTTALIGNAKSAIETALKSSEDVLVKTTDELSLELQGTIGDTTEQVTSVLSKVTKQLNDALVNFDNHLGAAATSASESIDSAHKNMKTLSNEQADNIQSTIQSVISSTDSIKKDIDNWKEEVGGYLTTASQSATSQLEQTAVTDQNYLEAIRNTLNGHLERIGTMVSDEYTSLASLLNEIEGNFSKSVDETKIAMGGLLKSHLDIDREHLEASTEQLSSDLDSWVSTTSGFVSKRLKQGGDEVNEILDSSAKELDTLTTKISEAFSSSLRKLITSSATQNETILTTINKSTESFEADMDSKIGKLISRTSAITDNYIDEAKDLYEGLNTRLDTRLANTLKTLKSQVNHARGQIEGMIDDQITRIDKHASGIREEFQVQLDDITKQFITLTDGLKSAFNGLLASQIIETRDFISSTHTEFNVALNSEMTSFQEESLKLQQEYSSEVGIRLDKIRETTAKLRKDLEEFTQNQKQEITDTIVTTVANIESSATETQEKLAELEEGTVQDVDEQMKLLNNTFSVASDTAKTNLSERLTNASSSVESRLNRSTKKINTLVDEYFTTQIDQEQRILSEANKRFEGLSTDLVKNTAQKLESFQTRLVQSESDRVNARTKAKDEVAVAIEERKTEATSALNTASVWLESEVNKIESTLDGFAGRLSTEFTDFRKELTKSGKDAAKKITSQMKDDLSNLEQIEHEMLQSIVLAFKESSTELGESSNIAINEGTDILLEVPNQVTDSIEKSLQKALKNASEKYARLASELTASFSEAQRASETASEDFKYYLDRVSNTLTENKDDVFEKAQQSTIVANQYATRKLESIGLDLKARLNADSYRYAETIRNDVASKSLEITNQSSRSKNLTEEETSMLKQNRVDILTGLSGMIEKTLKKWVIDETKRAKELGASFNASIDSIREITENTLETTRIISEVGEDLLKAASTDTWYLTGEDEICAHITDMAMRAEDSILISVLDVNCLDIKKLAKVKGPDRKVIVVPHSEDLSPQLDTLADWRIWHVKTPILLAVSDDKEILLSGSDESKTQVAVLSSERSYMQLYHDIIGPRIIHESTR